MSDGCGCETHDEEKLLGDTVDFGADLYEPATIVSGGATKEEKAAMDSRPPYIGIHLHLEKHTADAALTEVLRKYPEITDVQIFTHGPQSTKPTKAYNIFAPVAAMRKVRIWTHGSYLCVPWNSIHLSMHTLDNIQASVRLGSRCTVVHIPFARVSYVVSGISHVIKHMRAMNVVDTKLMLEVSATIQDELCSYESPEKLNRLTDAIFAAGYEDCVRICVDTAHIFAGRAKISSYDDAKAWWKTLDTRLIGMIHLNGSSHDPDLVRGDKHEVPMSPEDLIWGVGNHPYETRGCRAFIEHGRRLGIPIILEVAPRHSSEAIRKFITMTKPA